ncbi:minor capsid protein precursor [Psittacine aviadenovirus B]|uniref:Minor capsid protein n=1 Tax=psittacine adenovirus 4 TaxID=2773287 RepID=A0A1P8SW74_9ADEN|nr:minor capsid protein precursor [Psittacine aviadenovirus B]APY28353.1 minor capsid protein precursor [psittacine adenovirus 4]
MDYAVLSPHIGSWALRDHHLGDSSLRGGAINWGNLGSRISSALSTTGRWLYNQGNRFVHSNAFNQFKQGVKDSGIIRNVGNLAGETVNALADIGRLRLQQDLEKLRRKALGEEGPPASQAELLSLIQALQAQLASGQSGAPAAESVPTVPTTRPIPSMVTEVHSSSTPAVPLPVQDAPATLEYRPPIKRRRKRARDSSWRNRLDSLTGTGVRTSSRRMCY